MFARSAPSAPSSPATAAGPAAHALTRQLTRRRILEAPPETGGAFCFRPASAPARQRRAMDFSKLDGLIPAVVQDDAHRRGADGRLHERRGAAQTRETGFATFFSRTRGALWTRGKRPATGSRSADPAWTATRTRSLLQGASARRRHRLPHGRADLLLTGSRSAELYREAAAVGRNCHDAETRHSQGLAAGRDDPAVRARRLQHLRVARARTSRPSTIRRSSAC